MAGTTIGTADVPVLANSNASAGDIGKNTLFTRSTVGVGMGAASGATPSARFFVDFYVTGPLFGGSDRSIAEVSAIQTELDACTGKAGTDKIAAAECTEAARWKREQVNLEHQFKDPLDTSVWAFFNPRITSVSQSNIALGSFAPANPTIFQSAATTDLSKLVQSFEMEQGLEVRLFRSPRWMPDTIGEIPKGGSSGSRLGLFGYGSYGVGVPLTGQQSVSSVYVANAALDSLYGAPSGTQYIAVIENSKNRFYRDYYLGLRLKTFSYDVKPCKTPVSEKAAAGTSTAATTTPTPTSYCPVVRNEFPGVFDVAWGQDDTINGQRLTGGVARLSGFYPLPFSKAFHLFGGVKLSLGHKSFTNNAQFVLAPGNITPTSAGVFQVGVNPPARDQYSFGIGVDLLEVLKQYKTSQNKQPAASTTATAPPATTSISPPTNTK